MGGGALREARRACGSKRPLGTGLVLTAVALAVAGAGIGTLVMSGARGCMTYMHDGAAGDKRGACGTGLCDGGIHYTSVKAGVVCQVEALSAMR